MSEQESDQGVEGLCGYSTKKVVTSVALACVLHVVVIAGYVVLGHSKKPKIETEAKAETKPEGKTTETKPGTKDDKNSAAKPDGKTPDKEPARSSDEPKKSIEEKKNTEVATPNEIPKSPDNDLDEIIKRK